MIYSLLVNTILFIALFIKNKLYKNQISDPFTVILIFIFIYSFIPACYIFIDSDILNLQNWPLINKTNIRNLIDSSSILYIVLLIFYVHKIDANNTHRINRKNYLLFFLIWLISISTAYKFPWPEFGEDFTFGHTLVAYLKYFLLISFVKNYSEKKIVNMILIISILIFILIEHSRTFLFMFVISILYLNKVNFWKVLKYFPILLLFSTFLIYVTLSRNNIEFSYINGILWVGSVETLFSTYSTLQAFDFQNFISMNFDLYEKIIIPIYSMIDIVINPEEIINQMFSSNIDSFYDYTKLYTNKISPMGGHFVFSEHLFRFQSLYIFTTAIEIFIFLSFIRNIKNQHFKILIVSMSFMIVKSPIVVILKTITLIFIAFYIYNIIHKVKLFRQ